MLKEILETSLNTKNESKNCIKEFKEFLKIIGGNEKDIDVFIDSEDNEIIVNVGTEIPLDTLNYIIKYARKDFCFKDISASLTSKMSSVNLKSKYVVTIYIYDDKFLEFAKRLG